MTSQGPPKVVQIHIRHPVSCIVLIASLLYHIVFTYSCVFRRKIINVDQILFFEVIVVANVSTKKKKISITQVLTFSGKSQPGLIPQLVWNGLKKHWNLLWKMKRIQSFYYYVTIYHAKLQKSSKMLSEKSMGLFGMV